MRTTITVEDGVMEKLIKYTRSKTRTEAVNRALKDWVQHLKIEKLRSLRGKLYMKNNWEKLRSMEIQEARAALADVKKHGSIPWQKVKKKARIVSHALHKEYPHEIPGADVPGFIPLLLREARASPAGQRRGVANTRGRELHLSR
jgi:Arc/MetJ family transcription regulator